MRAQKAQRGPTRHDRAFHNVKPEYGRNSLEKALRKGQITSEDAELITAFLAEMRATRGIGISRSNKICYQLVHWREFIGPYRENTIQDLYAGIDALNQALFRGKPYTQNTRHDHVDFLKRFYAWLIENGHSSVLMERILKIRPPPVDRMTKTAADILTREEIRAMVNACLSSRDRAIIMVLYESGCRIQELGVLAWHDLVFDQNGAVMTTREKTGIPRRIRLFDCVPYLAAWKNDYPFTPEEDAVVFVTEQHRPLAYEGIRQQLKRIVQRAGITKEVTPHVFRHSRITHMVQEGYSEAVVKMQAWGNPNTDQLRTYNHITFNDVDREILERRGIKPKESPDDRSLAARQCVHCSTLNAPTSEFCTTCGMPLTEEILASLTKVMEYIDGHPRVAQLIQQARA